MNYFKQSFKKYPSSYSKEESVAILKKYQKVLSKHEYDLIYKSLCSLSMEGMYLDEKAILMSISQVKNEITFSDILGVVKSA